MRKPRASLAACAAALALMLWPLHATAAPFESEPDAAARDPHVAAGKAAMEKEDWDSAARHFARAAQDDPGNADVQNHLGYAYRHLKQYDLAFRHYDRAIELDPRHRGAHEYAGEAYLMVGNLAGAQKHLAALRNICLLSCEELEDLEKAVAAFRARAK